jgi:hypothetical protein
LCLGGCCEAGVVRHRFLVKDHSQGSPKRALLALVFNRRMVPIAVGASAVL